MALLATGLRTLFPSLVCFVLGAWIYVMLTDGLTVQKFLTPWMAGCFVDFYIYVFPFAVWVLYKESNLLLIPFWIVLLVCTGSMGACSFTFVQFLKLSPKNLQKTLSTMRYCDLNTRAARAMVVNLIDMCANFIALSVWVAYKETSWLSASMWIALLILPGGIAAFIAAKLFQLSSQDPLYLVLVRNNSRAARVPLLRSVKSSGRGSEIKYERIGAAKHDTSSV